MTCHRGGAGVGWRGSTGYTLVEAMVASVILTLMLGALYTVLVQGQVVFQDQQNAADRRQQARVAINKIAGEARLAGFGLGNLPEALFSAGPELLSFAADIDDGDPGRPCDGAFEMAAGGGAERVTYEVRSGTLFRTLECWDGQSFSIAQSDQPVVQALLDDEPVFRYFDAEGNELVPAGSSLTASDREAVRTVHVVLRVPDPMGAPVGDAEPVLAMESRFRLRNVGVGGG